MFLRHFRPARMAAMAAYFDLAEDTKILDLGGGPRNWTYLPFRPRLTFLNLGPRPAGLPADIAYVEGDARDTPFADGEFDLVYSNSVIEHVGAWADQKRMAGEIRRVGKSYYVQTPNYAFPFEPHLITPVFHWLPKEARRGLIRNFTIWGLVARPTRDACDAFIDSTRLLGKREMAALFPEADWLNERFLLMDKSIIAARRDDGGRRAG